MLGERGALGGAIRARIIEGTGAGLWAPLRPDAPPVRVGRRRELELSLEDPLVGEEHLALQCCPEGIAARALDPARAVFIGAVRIIEAVVPVGTRLRLGSSILLLETQPVDAGAREALRAEGLVFQGAAMAEVAETILRIAPHTNTVLIEGETGTGKEVVARAIHRLGLRANGPFVVVDCGALPANLLESELFGHERGSFTGADRRYQGAFERAHGGTLFLDEIGELPL
ncbi:MAG TPA: sigma 54-interacting transcriptional regulator, partial [Candidatus Nanopelagicales bacterium]|nr:sigma 54-interacting transcriptional regulator [Candidatus Nanopelagicales bacterium]